MPNVRYWAGARAATGMAEEEIVGATVTEVLDEVLRRHPQAAAVIARCSFLVDEVAVHDRDAAVGTSSVIEVLPPFAGGAR